MLCRILIGLLYFVVGCYDFIFPGLKNVETGVDFRDVTLDVFFVFFGLILTFGSVFEEVYGVFGLTFLESSFGVGLFLTFSGFLVVSAFNLARFQTWVAFASWIFGILFVVKSFCTCCASTGEASAEEQASLLSKNASAAGTQQVDETDVSTVADL